MCTFQGKVQAKKSKQPVVTVRANKGKEKMLVTKGEEDYDLPLLVEERKKLLDKPGDVDLPRSVPIFMFMKLAGAGKGINLVFDTAATGLVTLNHIPGRQLKAMHCKGEAVTLEGLGKTKNIARK